MPYGPGAKAEVLSILAFRAYPVNRGFATGESKLLRTSFRGHPGSARFPTKTFNVHGNTTWANSYPALGSAFQKIGTRRPVPREIVVLMDAALAGCN